MQKWMVILAATLGACARISAHHAAPAPIPAPDTATLHTAAAPTPGADSVRAAPARQQARTPRADSSAHGGDSVHVDTAEVTRRAAEVFGEPAPAKPSGAVDASAEPTWDMEVLSYESTDRVQFFIQRFSGPARERIESWLERGSRYEPMIRAKMRAGGLPEDMYYLGLVESGYDPNAYSRAAAVGMWQFMTSTARDMGMRVDWWVDERRDPVRSTSAAVRFIRGLREQFGSLYLAAAAYDGGPGRISRGLTRYADDLDGTTGEDVFFALADKNYLRRETKDYVPQLIAAALIGKDPKRYGMQIKTQQPFTYDSVRVGPATPLSAIAKASDTSVAAIKELNPQILRGMTPPKDSFKVRIPQGSAASFDSAFAGLSKEARAAYHVVESKKGDRMESVARRAGLSTKVIEDFNPKLKRSRKTGRLFAGQSILVPTPEVAAAAVSVPDPAIERYPGSRIRSIHIVKHGETLSGIAMRNHTTVKSLMSLNGLRRPMIFPGQELVVVGRVRRAGSGKASTSRSAKKSARVRTASHPGGKKSRLAQTS